MPATLASRTEGQTLILTWSNPELRNAFGPDIYAGAVEALNAAESSPDIRSVILTGAGANFSAGENLLRLQADLLRPDADLQASVQALHGWIESICAFPKPVIAAVEGAAAGAGFSVALACDFLVAARNAQFVMSYCRLGLSPDAGASFHLARPLPRQLVNEVLMLGQHLDATKLHAMGVVNRLSESGGALTAALQLAEQLNIQAPNVLSSVKDLLARAPHGTLTQQLEDEAMHSVRNLRLGNAREGIAAFLAKRTPHYR